MNAPLDTWNVSADDFPVDGTSEEKLWFLVRYAILAPSTHNTQPWRFRIHGNVVELYADFTRALPVIDPEDRELIMSCGAALLHLRFGLRSSINRLKCRNCGLNWHQSSVVSAFRSSCYAWASGRKSNRHRAAQPKKSSSNRSSTPCHSCRPDTARIRNHCN